MWASIHQATVSIDTTIVDLHHQAALLYSSGRTTDMGSGLVTSMLCGIENLHHQTIAVVELLWEAAHLAALSVERFFHHQPIF